MKIVVIAITLAFMLGPIVHGEEKPISDLFRIADAVGYVFVKEVPIGDEGEFGYEAMKQKGETKGALEEALKSAAGQNYSPDGSYPFIGILARVMLLGREGEPICSIEVVNWDRTIVFNGVDATGGKNRIKGPRVVVRSDALSRWVYNQVRDNTPEQFKRMQEMYAKHDRSIETLLFPKPTSSDAEEPATAPESKPEGEKKAKTESEGRSQ